MTGLTNSSGSKVVEYCYDTRGRLLKTTGSLSGALGQINPLRYRGYVYDQETGLYYLQSRYYNPEMGRFINADSYASTGQSILGNNMFAYCQNNPVNYQDPTGKIAISTIILIGSIVVGVLCAGATAYVEYEAGVDTFQIVGDSVAAGVSGFMLVYSLGTTLYQCYQNYCYLHSITPVTQQGNTSSTLTATEFTQTYSVRSGLGSPKNNPNPNGAYIQYDNTGNMRSYAQYDAIGNQTLRIDFQGRPHAGILPHIHLYSYPEKGGRVESVFDLYWNLID